MRVAHIAYLYGLNNTGGACMAATRLHLALLRNNVDSHFICLQQKEPGPNVHELPAQGILRAIQYVLTRIVWVLGYLTPEHRIIMPNLVPLFTLERTLRKIKPDIVHIHWYMLDTISFAQLANMPCPVVMTLHDLFDVNIEEPHPGSDRRFITDLTPSNSSYYERWLFTRKKMAMQKAWPFMTGPSHWACEQANASIIGKNLRYRVISNVLGDDFYYDPALHRKHNKFQLLFGASGGRTNPAKGWADFVQALAYLPNNIKSNIELTVFGETANDYCESGIPTHFLGSITSAEILRTVYNAADFFVFPSQMETQGMVKIEAWLCGLPVIAFKRTACAEHIIQKENGWAAQDGNFSEFAEGIAYFYRRFKDGLLSKTKEHIAQWAQQQFNENAVLDAMQAVYSEAANGPKK